MSIATLLRNFICVVGASLLGTALGAASAFAQQTGPIKIGLLVPLTGPLATPGADMVDGFKLFWEQVNNTAGGRKVEYVIADTTCNPDQAITQARRLVHQEKVQIMIGPLCGHEGPAVAQVSKETGIPLVMDTAGADDVTKWNRTPTVVRTAVSASQIGHPFGDYLFKELGARNVLITQESGCFALLHEEREVKRFRCVAPLVETLSSVGSGDVLLAGFLAARHAGKPIDEALRAAVAAGAASTLEVGAGRFDPREVSRLLGGVEVAELEPVVS